MGKKESKIAIRDKWYDERQSKTKKRVTEYKYDEDIQRTTHSSKVSKNATAENNKFDEKGIEEALLKGTKRAPSTGLQTPPTNRRRTSLQQVTGNTEEVNKELQALQKETDAMHKAFTSCLSLLQGQVKETVKTLAKLKDDPDAQVISGKLVKAKGEANGMVERGFEVAGKYDKQTSADANEAKRNFMKEVSDFVVATKALIKKAQSLASAS